MTVRAFITGANRGLGFALSQLLAGEGHTVFAGAYPAADFGRLDDLRQRFPDRVHIVKLDVTDDASVNEAFEFIRDRCGALDVVVNNAGVLLDEQKTIDDVDLKEMETTFRVNTFGPYRVVKFMLPLIYRGQNQCIINICSEAASLNNVGTTYCSYSMSKAAMNMMNQMFSNFLEGKGIRSYAVHPGRMKTDMNPKNWQIEPKDSARGIYGLITGKVEVSCHVKYINYLGQPMPL